MYQWHSNNYRDRIPTVIVVKGLFRGVLPATVTQISPEPAVFPPQEGPTLNINQGMHFDLFQPSLVLIFLFSFTLASFD